MPPESLTTERSLIEQFLETLRALPEVHAGWQPGASESARGYDAQIDLHIAGKSLTLRIEVKKAVYPRDAHPVLWRSKDLNRCRSAEQAW